MRLKEYIEKENLQFDTRGLNIFDVQLSDLDGIDKFTNLEVLHLENLSLGDCPIDLSMLNLFSLTISRCHLRKFPIVNEKMLESLFLASNHIKEIPNLSSYKQLTTLDLSGNRIESISGLPIGIYDLNLDKNRLTNVDFIKDLIFLEELNISYNRITSLPNMDRLTRLKRFSCHSNELTMLPDLSNCKLTYLSIAYNLFEYLPDLSGLKDLEVFGAYDCCLREIKGLENLKKLSFINLDYNCLSELVDITDLDKLNIFTMKGNYDIRDLTDMDIPDVKTYLKKLRRAETLNIILNDVR